MQIKTTARDQYTRTNTIEGRDPPERAGPRRGAAGPPTRGRYGKRDVSAALRNPSAFLRRLRTAPDHTARRSHSESRRRLPKERYSAYPQFTSVEAAFFIRDVAGGNNVSGREEKQLDEQGGTLRAPRSATEGRNRACVRDVRCSQDSTRLKLGHSSDVVSCRGRARPTTGCGPNRPSACSIK